MGSRQDPGLRVMNPLRRAVRVKLNLLRESLHLRPYVAEKLYDPVLYCDPNSRGAYGSQASSSSILHRNRSWDFISSAVITATSRLRDGLNLAVAAPQYFLNLCIGHLPELGIPFAHREKRFGQGETNEFVCFSFQLVAGL